MNDDANKLQTFSLSFQICTEKLLTQLGEISKWKVNEPYIAVKRICGTFRESGVEKKNKNRNPKLLSSVSN